MSKKKHPPDFIINESSIMRLFFLLFLGLVCSIAMAQTKKNTAFQQIDGHPLGVICKAGEFEQYHIILPPAKSRNNPSEPAIFEVTFDPVVPAAARAAFNRATEILSGLFASPIPIVVNVRWDSLAAGSLAGASPGTYLTNFTNAPIGNVWYPVALAEKIARRDFNNGNSDINVTVNNRVLWYYNFNNPQGITTGQFDFLSVILHELLHGMGFSGFSDLSGNSGTQQLQGLISIYSHYVENGAGQNLAKSFDDPSITLGAQLRSENLFLGTSSFRSSGNLPKIFAPANFARGSSISHLDELAFNNTPNSLMTPFVNPGVIEHDPGIATDVLYDLGWVLTSILHQPSTGEVDVNKPFVVNAQVVSDNGYNASTIKVHYSQDTFKTVTSLLMMPTENAHEFTATIPAPGEITRYQYYFSVEDNRSLRFVAPTQAPEISFYEFFYEADDTRPQIVHQSIETIDDQASGLDLNASVTDFFTGVDSVFIEYKINGILQPMAVMAKDFSDGFRPDLWVGRIPFPEGGLSKEDVLEYRLVAIDKSPARNTATNPLNRFYTVNITQTLNALISYVNDFDTPSADFNGNGFSISRPAGFADEAIHSAHPYRNAGTENTLNFIYNLNVPIIIRKVDALIEFDEIVLVEPGEANTQYTDTEFWDYVIVEGRKNQEANWQPFLPGYDSRENSAWLATYNNGIPANGQDSNANGTPSLYRSKSIDMLQNGNFSAEDTVLVRFRLFSDPFAKGWGWAIDNLRIQDRPVAVEDLIAEQNFRIYPNPVGSHFLTIDAQFKQKVKEVEIAISDLYGRLILKQTHENFDHFFVKKLSLSTLPKGIYLLNMKLDGKEQISKRFVKN